MFLSNGLFGVPVLAGTVYISGREASHSECTARGGACKHLPTAEGLWAGQVTTSRFAKLLRDASGVTGRRAESGGRADCKKKSAAAAVLDTKQSVQLHFQISRSAL